MIYFIIISFIVLLFALLKKKWVFAIFTGEVAGGLLLIFFMMYLVKGCSRIHGEEKICKLKQKNKIEEVWEVEAELRQEKRIFNFILFLYD